MQSDIQIFFKNAYLSRHLNTLSILTVCLCQINADNEWNAVQDSFVNLCKYVCDELSVYVRQEWMVVFQAHLISA